MTEPNAFNHYYAEHAKLIVSSFYQLTGQHLIAPNTNEVQRYRDLYHAPFGVLSHNTFSDPIFNYGNLTALKLFAMTWDALVQLPSRLSAEPIEQKERQRLLTQVAEQGFVDDFQGIRIAATGQRFQVEKATVWNLIDTEGTLRGQAVALFKWSMLPC